MTPQELYALLDANDIEYEIVEIFAGVRILNIQVTEESNDD